MKIDLIGMILTHAGSRCFDKMIIDEDGKELDATHSLDRMIMEYAKVRSGGQSAIVVVPSSVSWHAAEYNARVRRAVQLQTGWMDNEVSNLVGDTVDLFRDGLTPDEAAETILAAAADNI